jgi:hypothetical protein
MGEAKAPAATEAIHWYYKPVAIALLTIFVLGPLALPLVWRTPVLSSRGKAIVTLLILGYTALLCWEVWVTVQLVLAQLRIT